MSKIKTKTEDKTEPTVEACPFCDARMERRKGRTRDYMTCTQPGCDYSYRLPDADVEMLPEGPPCPACGGASVQTGSEPGRITGPTTYYRCTGKTYEGKGDVPLSCGHTFCHTDFRDARRSRRAIGDAGVLEPLPG